MKYFIFTKGFNNMFIRTLLFRTESGFSTCCDSNEYSPALANAVGFSILIRVNSD